MTKKTKPMENFKNSSQTQAAFAEVSGINPKTHDFFFRNIIEGSPQHGKCLMKFDFEETKIYVRSGAKDLRKGVSGFLAVIKNEMTLDALSPTASFLYATKATNS